MILQALYAAAAAALLAAGGVSGPAPRVPQAVAVGAGLVVAAVLHTLFAHGREPPPRSLLVPAVVGAATEEIVWRWGMLAGAAPLVGWGAALALSTFGFAYRHTRSADLVPYLALGGAFGGVFLVTGRLAAAVVAHAGYNALAFVGARR